MSIIRVEESSQILDSCLILDTFFSVKPATMVYVIPSDRLSDFPKKPEYSSHKEENIFNSLKFFMVCSQILGVLPQENITATANDAHFKWKSWKVLYTLTITTLLTFAVAICFIDWFLFGYNFNALAVNVYYVGGLINFILYLRLARPWSQFIILWCRMDKIMNRSYGYPKLLDRRLRILSLVFFLLAIAERSLSLMNHYENALTKYGDDYIIEKFFYNSFEQLFRLIPFNAFTAVLCNLMEFYASFIWAFTDLFIILLSTALALRFKQISDRLVENQRKIKTQHFWVEIREDYDTLSILCRELDSHISYIVLASFSFNVYFLLVKIYLTLESVKGFIAHLHFIFSFVYLILKVMSVSLYAAWIHDESLEPASILIAVHSSSYNVEIQRLLTQISFDNVALTGCRMFKITRGMILSIAGAIVTYELVLIQFNGTTVD